MPIPKDCTAIQIKKTTQQKVKLLAQYYENKYPGGEFIHPTYGNIVDLAVTRLMRDEKLE